MVARIRRSPTGPALTPRYREIQGEIFRRGGGTDFTFQAFRNTPYFMYFCRHDQNDEGHFRYALEQDWDYGPVEFFTRVMPAGSGSGVVVLDGYYLWTSADDGAMPALTGWTAFSSTIALHASDQYIHKRISIFTAAPAAEFKTRNTSLLIYLRRPGAASSEDTYTASNPDGTAAANVGFIATRLRYRCNGFGA